MVDVVAQPARVSVSYVEWGAVIAGAVIASALSFVLLTAGTSVGLSLVSAEPGQSYSRTAASLAVFWMVAVPILSLLAGGYVAGRMRSALEGASLDETQFRDGIQGLLVWAVSVLIGGTLAFLTATSVAQFGAGIGQAAVANRGAIIDTAVDALLRPAVLEQPAAPDAQGLPAPTAAPATIDETSRQEIARAVAAAVADGTLSAEDKRYLAQVVATRTGLSPSDAEQRVDDAYAKAVEGVEAARKASVAAGLATVTALLLGLAAAWYAAQRGGHHRDHNIPAKFRLGSPPLTRDPLA